MIEYHSSKDHEELKRKLNSLECPFTWSMNEVINEYVGMETSQHDVEELIPILKASRIVMKIFVEIQVNKNRNDFYNIFESTVSYFEKLTELFEIIKWYV